MAAKAKGTKQTDPGQRNQLIHIRQVTRDSFGAFLSYHSSAEEGSEAWAAVTEMGGAEGAQPGEEANMERIEATVPALAPGEIGDELLWDGKKYEITAVQSRDLSRGEKVLLAQYNSAHSMQDTVAGG